MSRNGGSPAWAIAAGAMGVLLIAGAGMASAGSCCGGDSASNAACAGAVCAAPAGDAKAAGEAAKTVIGTQEMKALLTSKAPVVVLDARAGKWDDGRRIPGAIAVSPTATAEEVAKAVPAKDSLIVTYCANLKCQASAKLAENLKSLGYTSVLRYEDGIEGWTSAGNAVEAPKK
jgi:rhodanese-related sulfurtransferase